MKKYEDFIDVKEVAEITGYTTFTIRDYARRKILKTYRPSSKSMMKFKRSDVEKFMEKSNSEKTTFEIMQMARQIWPNVKHKLNQKEKDRLLDLQNIDLKGYLTTLKLLDKKYNDD